MTKKAVREEQQVYERLRMLAADDDDPRLMASLKAYEDARIDGLCHDGAWECAAAVMGATQSEISLSSKNKEK